MERTNKFEDWDDLTLFSSYCVPSNKVYKKREHIIPDPHYLRNDTDALWLYNSIHQPPCVKKPTLEMSSLSGNLSADELQNFYLEYYKNPPPITNPEMLAAVEAVTALANLAANMELPRNNTPDENIIPMEPYPGDPDDQSDEPSEDENYRQIQYANARRIRIRRNAIRQRENHERPSWHSKFIDPYICIFLLLIFVGVLWYMYSRSRATNQNKMNNNTDTEGLFPNILSQL